MSTEQKGIIFIVLAVILIMILMFFGFSKIGAEKEKEKKWYIENRINIVECKQDCLKYDSETRYNACEDICRIKFQYIRGD